MKSIRAIDLQIALSLSYEYLNIYTFTGDMPSSFASLCNQQCLIQHCWSDITDEGEGDMCNCIQVHFKQQGKLKTSHSHYCNLLKIEPLKKSNPIPPIQVVIEVRNSLVITNYFPLPHLYNSHIQEMPIQLWVVESQEHLENVFNLET